MVSRNFEEAFRSREFGCMKKCNCGVVHFDSCNEWDWDCGELEELNENVKKDPGKYVAHSDEIATTVTKGPYGNTCAVVVGCSCNGNDILEKVIQQNLRAIAKYLQLHAAELRERAKFEGLSDEDFNNIS